MFTKYTYKEQDITTDTLFKIEHIISIIAEKENVPFEVAYRNFLDSKVYGMLQRTNTLMWAENAEFIVDEYYREIEAKKSNLSYFEIEPHTLSVHF
jgi:outer membrane protease